MEQNKKPKHMGFAHVELPSQDAMAGSIQSRRKSSYFKLVYPNGVQLHLPMDIDPDTVLKFATLNVSCHE